MRYFYAHFFSIAKAALPHMATIFVVATVVFLVSVALRPRKMRLLSKGLAHDVLYYVFFNSVLGDAILLIPIWRLMLPVLRIFDWNLLADLVPFAQFLIFFIAADLVSYWHHRWMHTRWLWPFHSVHHEQRELTVYTAARKHLLEGVISTVMLLLLTAMLGAPPADAFWFLIIRYAKDATLHSGLNWRYGPFYWVVVSPLFHSTHHSIEEEVSNHNFGVFFSFWDHLFRTHRLSLQAPEEQGVRGLDMPTLSSQFLTPFRMARRDLIGTAGPTAERSPAVEPVGQMTHQA